jgi:ribonuclease-3
VYRLPTPNFNNRELLLLSLTHKSLGANNNERMEFLGDAILDMIVSDYLYYSLPKAKEGQLSIVRSNIVSAKNLSHYFFAADFKDKVMLQKGVDVTLNIAANYVEAIIGAIYLDKGYNEAKNYIMPVIKESYLLFKGEIKDSKSKLQELMQKKGKPLPIYDIVKKEGQDHKQTFTVSCKIYDNESIAQCNTIQNATKKAAQLILNKIEKNENSKR